MLSRIAFTAIFLSHLGYAYAGNDNEAISTAKKMLEEYLADPFSVQYRNIRVVHETKDPKSNLVGVCFEYNAKNRMGGYIGFQKELCTLGNDGMCWMADIEVKVAQLKTQKDKDFYRSGAEVVSKMALSDICD